MKRLAGLVFILTLAQGCYRTVIDTTAPRSASMNDATGVAWVSLAPVTHKADECPYGLAKVDAKMPEWGALAWLLTGGLIAPMTIDYYCVDPAGSSPGVKKPQQ
jgi:hypothetical protein